MYEKGGDDSRIEAGTMRETEVPHSILEKSDHGGRAEPLKVIKGFY